MNAASTVVSIAIACSLGMPCALPASAAQSVADGFSDAILAPPVTLAGTLGTSNGKLDSGDVNEDGLPDLAGFDDVLDRVVLFLSRRDGSGFAPAVPIEMTSAIFQYPEPRLVDLDGDGHLDLLGVLPQSGAASARLGDGTGAFGPLLTSGGGLTTGMGADVGDLDGDGTLDIVLAQGNPFTSVGKLLIMRGHGDGTFSAPATLLAARRPSLPLARDIDADGITDLLYTDGVSFFNDVLVVHRGLGGGAFAAPISSPFGIQGASAIAAADADGDGFLDLYLQFPGGGLVLVLVGAGNGSFAIGPVVEFPRLATGYLDVADMDRDGVPDVITSTVTNVLVQRMGRDGPIGAPASTPNYLGTFGDVLADDFDGDGLPDLARCGDSVEVLTGTLGPYIDIGHGGTGPAGTPVLEIVGTPAAHQILGGGVSGLPQLVFGLIVFGVHAEYAPFAGGVLVPSPDVLLGTVTGVGFTLGWPAGIPVGTAIYAQAVMLHGPGVDAPLPSNAVVIVAQ